MKTFGTFWHLTLSIFFPRVKMRPINVECARAIFPCSQHRFLRVIIRRPTCARAEGIFLTFIQILYLIIIRPRVSRERAALELP